MRTLTCKSFRVCYGTPEELLRNMPAAEYVIAITDRLHTQEIAALRAMGFVFHERFIKVRINIEQALRQLPQSASGGGVTVKERQGFTCEMLTLAHAAFDTDRRFHLEPGFDGGDVAKEMIEATAEQCAARQARIVTASHDGELLGFCTFLPCGKDYCNAMGLTARNMKGKLAAWPLYTQALRLLKCGGGYIGQIASANVASLNLHIQLGIKVTGTEDWYILRKQNG